MKFFVIVTVAAIFGLAIGFSPIAPAVLVTFLLVHKPARAEVPPPIQFIDRSKKGPRLDYKPRIWSSAREYA